MELEKRVDRLEKLHLWGGVIVVTLVALYFIRKSK